MEKKITTLLFDFDGTLLDTNELIIQTFEHVLNTHFPGQYDREQILPFLGPTLTDTFGKIDEENAEQLIAEYRQWNYDNHDRLAVEFDGVSKTLRQLKELGYKLAIVSTKRNEMVHKGIALLEAGNIFDTVIGLDDVQHAKPNPEPIYLALQRLNASKEEAIMIGDNYHDIVGGQNAGVKTAGVAWTIKGEDFLQKYQPDYMLQHISDLLPIVQGEKQ
ncbi:MAG TPA: pyrophosphatase PpaX [Sporosarcina sp.]|nr:pyrophosphatase PpaX [Sporosarcina sp.]